MFNQKTHWDKLWDKSILKREKSQPSNFAYEIIENIELPKGSKILDLACGRGDDLEFFLEKGFKVVAVDFSNRALKFIQEKFKPYWKNEVLKVKLIDLNQKFLEQKDYFDLVYSNFGLHYFSLKRTNELFKSIFQILKLKGWLAFTVKSLNDPLFGCGTHIKENMYLYNEHLRQFLKEDFLRNICLKQFKIIKFDEVKETSKVFFQCLAQKS